jgi:cyclin B
MSDSSSDEGEFARFTRRQCLRARDYHQALPWRPLDPFDMDDDSYTSWQDDYREARTPIDTFTDDVMDDGDGEGQHQAEYAKLGLDANHALLYANYMKTQPEVDAPARASMVDWLVNVHMKYRLKTETLFLAVSILDRFLATKRIRHRDLQLAACTSAFIAAKFEEAHPPEVRDFIHITDQSCRKDAILEMEVKMLTALEFCLCQPTAAHYLERFQRENNCSELHRTLLQYILELALMDIGMIRFAPCTQARAAALVSSRLLKSNQAGMDPPEASECSQVAVQSCAEELYALLQTVEQNPMQTVRHKYSKPELHSVATIPLC